MTGEVLIRCTYKGARTAKPRSAGGLGAVASSYHHSGAGVFPASEEMEDGDLEPLPVLHWLQVRGRLRFFVFVHGCVCCEPVCICLSRNVCAWAVHEWSVTRLGLAHRSVGATPLCLLTQYQIFFGSWLFSAVGRVGLAYSGELRAFIVSWYRFVKNIPFLLCAELLLFLTSLLVHAPVRFFLCGFYGGRLALPGVVAWSLTVGPFFCGFVVLPPSGTRASRVSCLSGSVLSCSAYMRTCSRPPVIPDFAAFFAVCRCRHYPRRCCCRCCCCNATLQEKAWLVYVVLLLLSVLYRFALSSGFSGEPIALRSGTPIPNKTSPRSSTHYMTLKRESSKAKQSKAKQSEAKRSKAKQSEANQSEAKADPGGLQVLHATWQREGELGWDGMTEV